MLGARNIHDLGSEFPRFGRGSPRSLEFNDGTASYKSYKLAAYRYLPQIAGGSLCLLAQSSDL